MHLAIVTSEDEWVLVWAPRGAPAASCRWRIGDLADERILQAGFVSHQRLADEHNLVLDGSVDAAGGKCDVTRVQRVLDNLISNAIKDSPGGGTVAIGVALARRPLEPRGSREAGAPESPEEVEVGAAKRPLGVLWRVRDRGIGIRADDLPFVFERFRRGGNVRGSAGGSGIGLSNVKQIVQQHGGAVAIASREGEGTTVSVWLPLKPFCARED